jgi:hypothetical protein
MKILPHFYCAEYCALISTELTIYCGDFVKGFVCQVSDNSKSFRVLIEEVRERSQVCCYCCFLMVSITSLCILLCSFLAVQFVCANPKLVGTYVSFIFIVNQEKAYSNECSDWLDLFPSWIGPERGKNSANNYTFQFRTLIEMSLVVCLFIYLWTVWSYEKKFIHSFHCTMLI